MGYPGSMFFCFALANHFTSLLSDMSPARMVHAPSDTTNYLYSLAVLALIVPVNMVAKNDMLVNDKCDSCIS